MVGFVPVYLGDRVKARRRIFQVGRTVGVNRNACEGLAEGKETRQLGTKDACGT